MLYHKYHLMLYRNIGRAEFNRFINRFNRFENRFKIYVS